MTELKDLLAIERSVEDIRQVNNKIVEYFINLPYQEEIYEGMEKERQLPREIFKSAKAFGVNPDTMLDDIKDLKDNGTGFFIGNRLVFADRFVFPVFDVYNNVMGFVGNDPFEDATKYMNSHTYGCNLVRYNFYGEEHIIEYLQSGKLIYFTEGIYDCLVLRYLGYQAICTLGKRYNKLITTIISKFRPRFRIVMDNDDAGMKSLKYLRAVAGPVRAMKTIHAKDINDEIKYLGSIDKFNLEKNTKPI